MEKYSECQKCGKHKQRNEQSLCALHNKRAKQVAQLRELYANNRRDESVVKVVGVKKTKRHFGDLVQASSAVHNTSHAYLMDESQY